MKSSFLWFVCVCVLIPTNLCIPLGMFYPYGSSNGDNQLHKNDDGSSNEIHISTAFPFFNHSERSLFVNNNGDLTFISALPTYTPESFPFQQNARVIATYWADVDTRTVGDVWYREANNTTLLGLASSDIRSTFSQQSEFNASWMFITTWDRVGFYGADAVGETKRCTFQCILVTDGKHSFVIFNYNLIRWTTGTSGGGNISNGLGGTPAQVGFDAGDAGVHFYAVPGSQTPGIINITQMSNVGIPGKFIFRVDQATIERVTSVQTSTLPLISRRQTIEHTITATLPATEDTVTSTLPAKEHTVTSTLPTTVILTTFTPQKTTKATTMTVVTRLENTGMRTVYSCFGDPCQHGTCIPLLNRLICVCDLGYEGLNCQIDTNDCAKEPCQYGYCVDQVNDFVCECVTLFNGKRCTKLKTWAIITTTVASVVLYIMSCCCCIFVCKRKNGDAKAKPAVIPYKQKPFPTGKPEPSKAGKPNAWMFV